MSEVIEPRKHPHMVRVRNQFDRFSKKWERLYEKPKIVNDLVLQDRKEYCLNFIEKHVPSGAFIVDLGCGAGILALALARKGYRVYGIDISRKMIKRCNKLFEEHQIDRGLYAFRVGECTELDIDDDSVDGIVAAGFMEYQPDELLSLQSMFRILKPGGVLVITAPMDIKISGLWGLAKLYGVFRRLFSKLRYGSINRRHAAAGLVINRYSTRKFLKILRAANFSIVEFKRHGFANFWPLQNLSRERQYKIEYFLYQKLNQLSRFLPIDRWANELIVVARKPMSR